MIHQLYYLCSIIFIAYELYPIVEHRTFINKLRNHTLYVENESNLSKILSISYFLWCILGLFTNHAWLFGLLLILSVVNPILRLIYPKYDSHIVYSDSIISIVILFTIYIKLFI